MIVARHEVPGKRPPKEPSRRVRYDRALLIPEIFLVKSAWLLFDVMGLFMNTQISFVFTSELVIPILQSSNRSAHTCEIRPYPTGRLFWGGDSQALRAWLRSHCPCGTKAIRP
jgi:hypothetical protein